MRARAFGNAFAIDDERNPSHVGPYLQGEIHKGEAELHLRGDQPVTLNKMFGPLIFMDLRVTALTDTCEWVVERQTGPDEEWVEFARIPGQLDSDFPDDRLTHSDAPARAHDLGNPAPVSVRAPHPQNESAPSPLIARKEPGA